MRKDHDRNRVLRARLLLGEETGSLVWFVLLLSVLSGRAAQCFVAVLCLADA
jgi:hypothetical protein